MPRKSPIRPEDIYEIRQPLQCRLSPDGKNLAVVVSQPHRETLKTLSHVWMVAAQGGRSWQFTFGKSSEHTPRWSPDGRTLAFLSDRSGKTEIWTMPADGGEARQLTQLKGAVRDFDWHPGGRHLAAVFVEQDEEAKEREEKKKRGEPGTEAPRVRTIHRLFYKMDGAGFIPQGRSHLHRIDARTGRSRPLTTDDRYDEEEPRYSPDGRWIYFTSNRSKDPDLLFQRLDLWRVPSRGGTIQRVRSFDGPSQLHQVSPDGKWLVYVGTPDPDAPWNQYHTKLWMIPAAGGRPVELTRSLDRSCYNSTISDTFGLAAAAPPVWSPDSRWVYWTLTNEGNSEIWRVRIDQRRPQPVLSAPGAVIDFAIDFQRGWIHSLWSDLSNPGEVRSDPLPPDPGQTRGRRVPRGAARPGTAREGMRTQEEAITAGVRTEFNTPWLARREVARPEEFWFEGKGRHRLQGWVLLPKRFNRGRKYPGVLYIHGGPATQYGRVFFHEFQVLAAKGYIVFYSNPRGGTGYSERHLNSIVGRWGTIDYDDLMRFTDTVLRRFRNLDRRRLAVAGGSYGGFMTNWVIGHTNRFACAITSRSISNLMSFVGSSDFGWTWPQEFASAGPWEDPKRYLKMSPLSYLQNMKTPTLIEHQEEDHRCPIEQAEQFWAALKARGVPVEFARYPGEPHGMSRGGRPDRRIDRLNRILDWLRKWLRR